MSDFARRVAAFTGLAIEKLEPLAAGSLSEVLLVRRPDGRNLVAKRNPAAMTEAAMLRALAEAGVPTPSIEGEDGDILLLAWVENDAVFDSKAWAAIGACIGTLHRVKSDAYGWPADYAIGAVELDNRSTGDWPDFWGRRRLLAIAEMLDRAWRERVERVAARLSDLLPERPAASLLHGDLWTGNILVGGGEVVSLVDPACCHGHSEVDLAMIDLFCAPPDAFREAYGPLEAGWRERLPVYQLFAALLNLRLWGERRAGLVDRLLTQIGA